MIMQIRKLVFVVGLAILVGVLGVGTLLAQGALLNFVPREVENLSLARAILEPTPPEPRLIDITELERLAGFSLLVPAYLPQHCASQERFYVPVGKEVILNYSCVIIAERKADSIQRPGVGLGSVQEITVNGRPALLIDGMWVKMPGEKELTWKPDLFHVMVFEHNGLIVRLTAPGHSSKDELIRIAASMQH